MGRWKKIKMKENEEIYVHFSLHIALTKDQHPQGQEPKWREKSESKNTNFSRISWGEENYETGLWSITLTLSNMIIQVGVG